MLSKKTKYGLKALIYIAKHSGTEPVLISEISDNERIPKKFLEAILLDLKKHGILGSKKGKGGGYYLLKDPNEITAATLIRVLDGPLAMLPCVSLNYYEKCDDCPDEAKCNLNKFMAQVRDNTLSLLQQKSLYDLAKL
ncbi:MULTISPECIES: RrF2 family transcriptional regulator [Flavobacterium]|uniref:Rrf2 family transcriptional regulator n=2 Tax=Flavobacterium TaxID=237 RepID=A0A0A2LYI9_9FLAO|nr:MULTISPECIES: Rrf2 family transcriptional regulator [Flavobacterium]KGO84268.1 Rrf2 family transcriptional regulator [Flavobacterium beibuense F44-8]MEE1896824.1 Rrf2 family transcriptional regulator [Flavobacterium rakeshii]MUV03649.1 Rrf2 family transcriptional regulator [Flavobacterium rakeshii]